MNASTVKLLVETCGLDAKKISFLLVSGKEISMKLNKNSIVCREALNVVEYHGTEDDKEGYSVVYQGYIDASHIASVIIHE